MITIPTWLAAAKSPEVIVQAVSHYGILEHPGKGSFPDYSKWTRELGIDKPMTDDDIPWCGVFVGICVLRAGFSPVSTCYWALNWRHFGNPVKIPMLGDILVFRRVDKGVVKGHVAFYVGETAEQYLILGGNQSNAVCVMWIDKERLLEARRCPWKIREPDAVKQVFLKGGGKAGSQA